MHLTEQLYESKNADRQVGVSPLPSGEIAVCREDHPTVDEMTARGELTEAMLIAGVMAYRNWEDRRRTDAALSVQDLISDIWVAFRRTRGYPHA